MERFRQRRQIVLNGIPDYGRAKVPAEVDREVMVGDDFEHLVAIHAFLLIHNQQTLWQWLGRLD
jgi:hypothetical protein